ncbi:nucleic acid-binding, OB-fold-like protein isoform X1 [Wolffia australiana]
MAAAAATISASSQAIFRALRQRLQISRQCFFPIQFSGRNFSLSSSSSASDAELGEGDNAGIDPPEQQRLFVQRPLENGLEQGVFKAILVGKVGQKPVQKFLKSGRPVTLFSLGTGGIRNNRRPLDDEDPRDYANRCAIQWHRVAVYPEKLGNVALRNMKPGPRSANTRLIYQTQFIFSLFASSPVTRYQEGPWKGNNLCGRELGDEGLQRSDHRPSQAHKGGRHSQRWANCFRGRRRGGEGAGLEGCGLLLKNGPFCED